MVPWGLLVKESASFFEWGGDGGGEKLRGSREMMENGIEGHF